MCVRAPQPSTSDGAVSSATTPTAAPTAATAAPTQGGNDGDLVDVIEAMASRLGEYGVASTTVRIDFHGQADC